MKWCYRRYKTSTYVNREEYKHGRAIGMSNKCGTWHVAIRLIIIATSIYATRSVRDDRKNSLARRYFHLRSAFSFDYLHCTLPSYVNTHLARVLMSHCTVSSVVHAYVCICAQRSSDDNWYAKWCVRAAGTAYTQMAVRLIEAHGLPCIPINKARISSISGGLRRYIEPAIDLALG